MQFVPFAFRDTVLLHFEGIEELSELCEKNPHYSSWSAAIERNDQCRLDISLFLGLSDNGAWSYSIHGGQKVYTFEEFKRLNRRRYLQVDFIQFGDRATHQASRAEIEEIVKFTLRYVNLARLSVADHNSNPKLFDFLPLYRNSTFRYIRTELYHKNIEDLLTIQLKSDFLRELSLNGEGWSRKIIPQIEEYALTKHFASIIINDEFLQFSRLFYERLKRKPVNLNSMSFMAFFPFEFEGLETAKYGQVRWTRQDGVLVKEWFGYATNQLSLHFERS